MNFKNLRRKTFSMLCFILAVMVLLTPVAVLAADFMQFSPSHPVYDFSIPADVEVDGDGNIYVADRGNNRILKLGPDGSCIAAWGSEGSGNGQFDYPTGVAFDSQRNIYVADSYNNRIQKLDSDGNFVAAWGSEGSGNGQFNYPLGVALDSQGNIYIADSGNYRIQKLDSEGNFLAAWGSPGSGNGQFSNPGGVTLDSQGNIYVADTGNGRIQKLDSDGNFVAAWGSEGSGNGQFNYPLGVALDSQGNIYVADRYNNRIQKLDSGGNFVAAWGSYGSGNGQFREPKGVALDSQGNIYVADERNNRIQKLGPDGSFICAFPGSGDGDFNHPCGVTVDKEARIYVADTKNHRIQKLDSGGNFIAAWGNEGSGNGQFNNPKGVAVDNDGNIYVADMTNQRIQKIGPDGSFIAAWGSQGSGNGQFLGPTGVALDSQGNIYVADSGNYRIQKLDSEGNFVAAWGSFGSGNGQFNNPTGVAVDKDGNIYVADQVNSRIQKLNPDGTWAAAWENGQSCNSFGIAVDGQGNIYATDGIGYIRKLGPDGSLIATWGSEGCGDGQFLDPYGVAVDEQGNVYVADQGNNRIQRLDPPPGIISVSPSDGAVDVPVDGSIRIYFNENISDTEATGDIALYTVPGHDNKDCAYEMDANILTITPGSPLNYNTEYEINIPADAVKDSARAFMETGYVFSFTTEKCGNAELGGLRLSSGTLYPAFSAGTTDYTASVPYGTGTIALTPTASGTGAVIRVNGEVVGSGAASGNISLNVGNNQIAILVTAQDNATTKEYRVTVHRDAPGVEEYSLDLTSYTLKVGAVHQTVVTAVYEDDSTYDVTGLFDFASSHPEVASVGEDGLVTALNGGETVITAVYGDSSATATVTVLSNIADLSGLGLSSGTLTPGFSAAETSYTASVANSVTSITVTPTAAESHATITVGGHMVISRQASSPVSLNVGGNVIAVIVTAQDGTAKKTYTVTVTRAAAPSNDNNNNGGSGSGGSSGGGGGGRPSNTAQPVQTPGPAVQPTVAPDGTVSMTVAPRLDGSTGIAAATITADALTDAFGKAIAGNNGIKTVVIEIPRVQGASAYAPTLPASFVASADASREILIKTDIAAVTVPGNMLTAAAAAQDVSLTIAAADKAKLDAALQAQIGNRPVIELNLKINGKAYGWHNDDAPVTVSVPYVPAAGEDTENITVWYIDGSGNAVSVPNGRYNSVTGRVIFMTTHFSKYAIVYVKKTFSDMSCCPWAKKAAEALAGKGIIDDTRDGKYLPGENITRGDYLLYLMKVLGLIAKFDSSFADVKPGDKYYEALGTAKKLGICMGTGNNLYKPETPITRQELMSLTVRALDVAKKLETKGTAQDLNEYKDKKDIAGYAVEPVATLVKEGLIKGDGSLIKPLSNMTRAEAAVLLYRIYNK